VNWNFLPAPHYHHFSRNNNALQPLSPSVNHHGYFYTPLIV
jgi:hypothetical protein